MRHASTRLHLQRTKGRRCNGIVPFAASPIHTDTQTRARTNDSVFGAEVAFGSSSRWSVGGSSRWSVSGSSAWERLAPPRLFGASPRQRQRGNSLSRPAASALLSNGAKEPLEKRTHARSCRAVQARAASRTHLHAQQQRGG
ncbi:hypothetical protein MHYP_G00144770 [Metynnis hypsauchen]